MLSFFIFSDLTVLRCYDLCQRYRVLSVVYVLGFVFCPGVRVTSIGYDAHLDLLSIINERLRLSTNWGTRKHFIEPYGTPSQPCSKCGVLFFTLVASVSVYLFSSSIYFTFSENPPNTTCDTFYVI